MDAPQNSDLRDSLAWGDFQTMVTIVDRVEERLGGVTDPSEAQERGLIGLIFINFILYTLYQSYLKIYIHEIYIIYI
jgi:hypothetical protein